jgi:anti-anti-sigma regulatory factor
MTFVAEEIQTGKPITILKVIGVLDATNYQDLIDRAQQLYQTGTRDLILDFSQVSFMSSSGILSLHDIAILMRGKPPPDIGEGWSAFHALSHFVEEETYYEKHLRLLKPQPRVRRTLEITGFDHIIKIFNDREAAIDSFGPFPEGS